MKFVMGWDFDGLGGTIEDLKVVPDECWLK